MLSAPDGWEEVEARFRALGQELETLSPMVARMLHLVALLRDDPRLKHIGCWVLDVSLILSQADRYVSVAWNAPDGSAWSAIEGFAVVLVDFREVKSTRRAIVDDAQVVAAILDRLESG